MRTMLLALSLLVPTIGPLASVAADPTPDVQKMVADDCARARKQNKTCVISIENEIIDGDKPVSTESTILVNVYGTHGSLIRLRRDFIPEILKTAEDL